MWPYANTPFGRQGSFEERGHVRRSQFMFTAFILQNLTSWLDLK
jgi:hypothetical protein